MQNLSSIDILIWIFGAIALVIILVVLFYKPGRKLHLNCNFIDEKSDSNRVELFVENNGKKKVNIRAPFVKFSQGTESVIYQIDKKYVNCKFPRILPINAKANCEMDISHYYEIVGKHFKPTHVKIILKDSVGMQFPSHSLDY